MLPETYKKIIVTQRGKDPHQCLKVVEVAFSQPHTHDILVKNHYAGVNALDIGRMMGLDVHHPTPPFDFGMRWWLEIWTSPSSRSQITQFPVSLIAICLFRFLILMYSMFSSSLTI